MDFCWSDINLLRKTTEINSLIQAVVAALGGRRRSGRVYLPYRATLWAVHLPPHAPSEASRFHIRFFGWFGALSVRVYLLTSIAKYDIPGPQATCRTPLSSPNLPAVKLHAKQCDFCDAANLASSALAGTSLATIQSLPMRYLHTHGERILRRSLSKT